MASDAIPPAPGPRLARLAIARLAILFMTYAVPGNAVMGSAALDFRAEGPGPAPATTAWTRLVPTMDIGGIDPERRRTDEADRPGNSTIRQRTDEQFADRAPGEPPLQPDVWFGLIGILALSAFALGATRKAWRTRDARLEEAARRCERERIARTLHDTLLQGTQGFILLAGAASRQMAPNDPARPLLEQALRQAEALMTEGRDRIQQLRATSGPGSDLPDKLATIGRELAGQNQERFRLDVEGRPRLLRPNTEDEALLIGREALINAFRHARASSIRVRLRYAESHLQLTVSDDGWGIGTDVPSQGGYPGHWGLRGMAERAAQIPARIEIRGGSGRGTAIDLHIAARVSYCLEPELAGPSLPMFEWFRHEVLRLAASCGQPTDARKPGGAVQRAS